MTGEALMRRVAAGFENADLRPLFEAIDERRIVWKSASTVPGAFRFSGVFEKRVGVVQVTSQIFASYAFRRMHLKEVTTSGDIVWGLVEVEADYWAPGEPPEAARPVQFECAVRWRLRSDKIVEHQCFFDTEALAVQQGRDAS